MSEQSGQIVIDGRVNEHGLPLWRMPDRVAIEFPEGRCRVVRGRHGSFAYYPGDYYLGRAIETYGEYAEAEFQAYRSFLGDGGVLIEVGANAGYLAVPLARLVGATGRVVAFEPQPAIHRLLCANVLLNGLTRVSCVNAAVGAAEGAIDVPEIDPEQAGNYGAVSLADGAQGRKAVRVPLVTLDRSCRGLGRLDVIKIDVEGMELDVLKGAQGLIERFRPMIVPENDRVDRSPALIAHLLSLGYCCYWFIHPLYNPANFFGVTANLYPGISSFNMLCCPAEKAQPQGLPRVVGPDAHPLAGRR